MNVRDVIERVRIKITDENAYRFTDENIILIVNDAVRLIRNVFIDEMPEIMCEPKVTGELADGENTIIVPFNPVRYIDVRCNGRRLHLSARHGIDDTEAVGEPELFVPSGISSIEVYPKPNGVSKYEVFAVKAAEELDIESELPFPDDFCDEVIEYTATRLSLIDEFDQSAETQLISTINSNVANKLQKYAPKEHVVKGYY